MDVIYFFLNIKYSKATVNTIPSTRINIPIGNKFANLNLPNNSISHISIHPFQT